MSESSRTNRASGYTKYVPFVGREYNLRMLLYLTEEAVNRARHAQVTKMGLTRADADLLFLVECLKESATPTELSKWLKRRPPTVSEHLDHMQAKGLLKRHVIRGNHKSKRVVLTRKGLEALQEAMGDDIIVSVMESLSEKEHQQLWRLLEKLKNAALSAAEAEKRRTESSLPRDQPA
jgi:DNA-binding MarR family transcriptional regulator